MRGMERVETSLGGFQFRESAAFLLDEVILRSTNAFRSRENGLPIRHALTKQNGVAFPSLRRPFLEMEGSDSAWIGANPRHGVRTGFDARAYIELQHHGRLRILRENFNRSDAALRRELRLMVVIPGLQSCRLQLFRSEVQRLRHSLPAIQAGFSV